MSSPGASSDHIEALDVMADLLLGIGEQSPPDAFFSSFCEAICRLTSMKRAVMFRYDNVRRRVRAVGAHNFELERFADMFVTVDSVPVARQSLVEDRVLEVIGASDFDVPESLRELLEGVQMICTPMAAGGRYIGVVFSERDPEQPPISEEEKHLLWTLGKTIAMASLARRATAYDERNRQLQQRIDLAREIHDDVVQRLFGVSLALSQTELLDSEAQQRCAQEVQAALADLRAVLQRPLGHFSPPTAVTFADELERLRGLHPELELRLEHGDPATVPSALEALAQSVLVESVRNASKHATASSVTVSLRGDASTFVLEIRNDGAQILPGTRGGMGLRLATLEALQHGGVLEYGEAEPGIWQVRLVVPTAAASPNASAAGAADGDESFVRGT
jgi:signal transduction histidine kinase